MVFAEPSRSLCRSPRAIPPNPMTPTTDSLLELPWSELPFSAVQGVHQVQLLNQVEQLDHKLGDVIWSTEQPGYQYYVLAGRVRLVPEEGPPIVLKAGEWFGSCLALSGEWKVRAADKVVKILRWEYNLWEKVATAEVELFWRSLHAKYQLEADDNPQVVAGYPYLASVNTAAACLAMASQQLGGALPLAQVSRQLKGQRPRQVVAAAETIGIHLRQIKAEWKDLRGLSFPIMFHWQQQYWVIAYGVKGDRLIVANPLSISGRPESLSRGVVEKAWDGTLWQVEPIQTQEKFGFSWFLPAVMQYKGLLVEVLVASLVLQVLGLGTPVFTQVVIDKALVQESVPTLDVMAIALLATAGFEALLGMLRMYLFTHTARRIDLALSAQVFRHLLRLPLSYFEARRVGDTVARVQELEGIRQFITGTAITVLLDSLFAVVYLAMMFYYSVTLTWVALAVIPMFALLTIVSTPLLRHWLNETFNRNSDSQSFLVETVTGIHAVKAHTAERAARDRWEGLFAKFVRTGFKASNISNISNNLADFLTKFSSLLILWYGAHLVIKRDPNDAFTIGQLIAFQMLSGRVTGPLLRLIQLWQNLQQVLLSVDRLGDILNHAPESEAGAGLVLPPLKGEVEFDQVVFRYTEAQQEPALKGISFKIKPGMLVGVVGRSGSGKSTLSKLLQRLYMPEGGRVCVDGIDLKLADLQSLRQQIGVVLQDDFLFNGSIRENITLNNGEITSEQMIEAAKLAAAHDFICHQPHGYDTNVGERGMSLSGGQRQRIALARMFLAKAPVIILDEATSALDAETEQQVMHNLQAVAGDCTIFLIAHRFAPLKYADLILVMDRGILAEQGTHEE